MYKNAIRIMGVRVGSPDIAGEKEKRYLALLRRKAKRKAGISHKKRQKVSDGKDAVSV